MIFFLVYFLYDFLSDIHWIDIQMDSKENYFFHSFFLVLAIDLINENYKLSIQWPYLVIQIVFIYMIRYFLCSIFLWYYITFVFIILLPKNAYIITKILNVFFSNYLINNINILLTIYIYGWKIMSLNNNNNNCFFVKYSFILK